MAGLIPQSFIDDLLNRTDIVDVVSSRVQMKKAGKNYTACCPFHKEKTPSFSVSPDKQFYYCFGCGAGGNALGFIMDHDNLDFPQAVEELAKAEGVAASAAAEAVVELLVGADAERRRLFFVERAAGGVVLAGLFHLQARADNIDDVGAVQKVVNKALGN